MNKHWQLRLTAAGFAAVSSLGALAAHAYTPPYTTPEGITLVDVSKVVGTASPQFLWRRLGDADGKPLYTRAEDKGGKSTCYGDCAKEFVPLAVSRGAKAGGDWTIVKRDDHVSQWAYQGQPLYRFSGTDPLGEPQSNNFQLKEDPAWHDPGSTVFSPKPGWRRAAYTPEKTAVMPTSIEIAPLPVANGVGFVEAATHQTIYAVPASRKLSREWQPLHAAALAVPLGDFSVITRKDDGTRQWTYHGDALYTFAGDTGPGDVQGTLAAGKGIRVALAYQDFNPQGIEVNQYLGLGPLMTTAKGQALYTVARFHATYGGREALGGYTISYNEVKAQGTQGCEGDCTEVWKPVLARSNAHAMGFWELIDRPKGVKQWAFKGMPVYTYAGDRKPGDIEGNNRYVVAFGGAHGEMAYIDPGTTPRDSHPPRVGSLTMAAAVGMKPGDNPLYVAGQGYVPPRPPKRPGAATDADADAGLGNGNSIRFPDHGAGFYWHVIQPFQ